MSPEIRFISFEKSSASVQPRRSARIKVLKERKHSPDNILFAVDSLYQQKKYSLIQKPSAERILLRVTHVNRPAQSAAAQARDHFEKDGLDMLLEACLKSGPAVEKAVKHKKREQRENELPQRSEKRQVLSAASDSSSSASAMSLTPSPGAAAAAADSPIPRIPQAQKPLFVRRPLSQPNRFRAFRASPGSAFSAPARKSAFLPPLPPPPPLLGISPPQGHHIPAVKANNGSSAAKNQAQMGRARSSLAPMSVLPDVTAPPQMILFSAVPNPNPAILRKRIHPKPRLPAASVQPMPLIPPFQPQPQPAPAALALPAPPSRENLLFSPFNFSKTKIQIPAAARTLLPAGKKMAIKCDNKLTDADLRLLIEKEPNIQFLDLSSCFDITDDGLAYLVKLPNLRSLSLFSFKTTDKGVAILSHLPHLEELALTTTDNITLQGLSFLLKYPHLEHLQIETVISDRLLQIIGQLGALKSLTLERNGTEEITGKGLNCLGSLHQLQYLEIGYLELFSVPEGGRFLYQLTRLRELHLRGALFLHDDDMAALKNMKELQILNLREGYNFTDAIFFYIDELPHLQSVEVTRCNLITGAGLWLLRKIRPNLKIVR